MSLAIGGPSAPPNPPRGVFCVDVRDFGAKADGGVTDNSVPFQAAVDAVAAKVAGMGVTGVVYIPSGNYCVYKSVWVDSDYVEIRGDGWGTVVSMVGVKQPVFIFGIPRVQTYQSNGATVSLAPDATNRPDLFGKLDSSVVAAPGSMWGLRTNGNSFVQFQATPLNAGAGAAPGSLYSDQWGQTSRLTVEFCFEPPDGQGLPENVNANILGCGVIPNRPSPFLVTVADAQTIAVFFRTSDLPADNEYVFHAFYFSIAGAKPPYRVAIQFDLDNAACSAFVNGTQVAFTRTIYMDPTGAVPFAPGAGLKFITNDYFPFMIGASDLVGPYGNATGNDLRMYGLRLSNTLRYQVNGPGRPQVRADSPATPLNDAWAYFGNDANTICWLWSQDNPATAGRVVTVAHGGAVYPQYSAGYLMHSLPPVRNIAYNAIRDIYVANSGGYGQTICVGAVYELTIENVKSIGGYHGVGSFLMGANYYVYVDHCTLDGADAGYFGGIQFVRANDVHFLTSGRATLRFVGSYAVVDGAWVAGWSPVCECIVKASSYGYGGNYTISNLLVDFEGYSISRAAIYCEAHPYTPATSLVLSDIYLGTVGASTPLVMLKDMGPVGPTFNNGWVSIENLQAYTTGYLAAIDIDGPLWHGEMDGVALLGPQFNHRQKWGTKSNMIIRDTKYGAPPRQFAWYAGAHVLEVRSPADGQYAEWRCAASGTYGTSTPPAWVGLNPLVLSPNGLAAYVLNQGYITVSLN